MLLGDHTHVVKDGRRMPGVVSLRENSETQHRPSYFRGQCWGALGLVVGTLGACFCLPLELRIHQGFVHRGQPLDSSPASPTSPTLPTSPASPVTMGERVVQMALAFAWAHDCPVWLVLDAFFPCAKLFRLVRSFYSIALKQPYVHLLVRAKKNYVAYCPAPPKVPHTRGRPPKYGDKVYLWECFDHPHLFHTTQCRVYGRLEPVQLMALPLLWKPLGDWVLFIFAISSRGPIILMSSDLHLSPVNALELYCIRSRIELMFHMLKNILGAFRFRFWTQALPRHPRRPRANRFLQPPAPENLATVESCWHAYEVFVLCASIALGLLQLIALRLGTTVWEHHHLYLRTQSRALPSENTVKQVLAPRVVKQFNDLPQISIIAKIQRCLEARDEEEDDPDSSVA